MPKVTFFEGCVSLVKEKKIQRYSLEHLVFSDKCPPKYTEKRARSTHLERSIPFVPLGTRDNVGTIDHTRVDLCCRGGGRVCRDSFSPNGGEHAKYRHRYGHNFLQTSPWRNCLHLPVQFPRDDTPLVVPGLGRMRKRGRSETVGTRARRFDDPRRSVHQGRRAPRIVERYTRPTRGCRFYLRASGYQSGFFRRLRSSGTFPFSPPSLFLLQSSFYRENRLIRSID